MLEKYGITKEKIAGVFTDLKNRAQAATILRDPQKAQDLVSKINSKLVNIPYVGEYFTDVPTLCLLISDYVKGDYKQVPFAALVGIVVALVYFLTPVDMIPDTIPGAGHLDDAAVILFAVKAAHNDIADFKKWKGL